MNTINELEIFRWLAAPLRSELHKQSIEQIRKILNQQNVTVGRLQGLAHRAHILSFSVIRACLYSSPIPPGFPHNLPEIFYRRIASPYATQKHWDVATLENHLQNAEQQLRKIQNQGPFLHFLSLKPIDVLEILHTTETNSSEAELKQFFNRELQKRFGNDSFLTIILCEHQLILGGLLSLFSDALERCGLNQFIHTKPKDTSEIVARLICEYRSLLHVDQAESPTTHLSVTDVEKLQHKYGENSEMEIAALILPDSESSSLLGDISADNIIFHTNEESETAPIETATLASESLDVAPTTIGIQTSFESSAHGILISDHSESDLSNHQITEGQISTTSSIPDAIPVSETDAPDKENTTKTIYHTHATDLSSLLQRAKAKSSPSIPFTSISQTVMPNVSQTTSGSTETSVFESAIESLPNLPTISPQHSPTISPQQTTQNLSPIITATADSKLATNIVEPPGVATLIPSRSSQVVTNIIPSRSSQVVTNSSLAKPAISSQNTSSPAYKMPVAPRKSGARVNKVESGYPRHQQDHFLRWLTKIEQNIGGYQILEVIASGGMGTIYKVKHPQSGKIMAIKKMQNPEESSDQDLLRFQQEARLAITLDHPNIVKVYDSGVQDKTPYIVMDYVSGIPLSRLIAKEKLPVRQAMGIIRGVLEGLSYAHRKGIIHRDIKPSNIMILPNFFPLIMDFGLAKNIFSQGQQLTKIGEVLGTPQYMSPEQARGQIQELSVRTDIYSAGVVLYEMLTGVAPVQGITPVDILYNVVATEPPPMQKFVPDLPPAIIAICQKAMEKKLEPRYSCCEDMIADISRYFNNCQVLALREYGYKYRFRKWYNKHRNQIIPVVIALLSVLICLLAMLILLMRK